MLLEGCKIYWAKLIGAPRPGYGDVGTEWSFDLSLTPESKKALIAAGAKSAIKNKDDEKGDFIRLKRKGTKSDGTPAKPISIVDHKNEPWDNRLIGNGSTVNVSLVLQEYGEGKAKKMSVRPIAVQVWELKKFEGNGGFPTRQDSAADSSPSSEDTW